SLEHFVNLKIKHKTVVSVCGRIQGTVQIDQITTVCLSGRDKDSPLKIVQITSIGLSSFEMFQPFYKAFDYKITFIDSFVRHILCNLCIIKRRIPGGRTG